MKLSIIIPVYNTEKYLCRCIDSVIDQFTSDCEIILVDDGSTDDSSVICDEYAANHKGLNVIHQENQGLSAARNTGIEAANGDYIMFLDSDDWIEKDSLQLFLTIINTYSPDLINGRAILTDGFGLNKPKIDYYIPDGFYLIHDYLNLLKDRMIYTPCAPFTLCKRSFLNDNGIRFKKGILHEDQLWTPIILLNAKNIYCSEKYFYYNYVRQGSITHSGNRTRSGTDLITVCSELQKELCKHSDAQNIEPLWDLVVRKYLEATVMLGKPVKDNRKISRKTLLQHSYFDKTKKKARLFTLSPYLYIIVAKMGSRLGHHER